MSVLTCCLLAQTAPLEASALTAAVQAPRTDAVEFEIGGIRFRSDAPVSPALRRSLEAQVRIVEALHVSPRVAAFLRSVPVRLSQSLRQAGASGPDGVVLTAEPVPPDNPVLLHELLHVYHFRQLPQGIGNAAVEQAYQAASAGGRWPPQSYMLSNKREFFAMTASAVLHGRVARPPFTGAAVRERMPDYHRWLLEEFSRP